MKKNNLNTKEQHCYWVWYDTNGGQAYESVMAQSFQQAISQVGNKIAKAATTIWDVYTLKTCNVSSGTITN